MFRKKENRHLLALLAVFLGSANSICSAPMELDNGVLRVKLDMVRGGAISYISISAEDRNLVNTHDEGRYIQQSYYAGNSLDRTADGQSPNWSPWPWNPIQAGDYAGNRAEVLVDTILGNDTLYTKCIPMLWDMNNEPAEATMEQWTVLDSSMLRVRNRLTCFRTDAIYGENISRNQELPAVYPISALYDLYSYFGDSPFTNGQLDNPEVVKLSTGFWGRYRSVTENWMAFVDESEFGMGVYNPQATEFLAGMAGDAGFESLDGPTSYIAPIRNAALAKTTVYEYEYFIMIGTLDQIRSKVYSLETPTQTDHDARYADEGDGHARIGYEVQNRVLELTFDLLRESAIRVRVLDMKGRNALVTVDRTQPAGSTFEIIDLGTLANGVYIIEARFNGNHSYGRVILSD